MKYFIVALLVLTFATSAYAAYTNPMVNIGLMYAQQSLGFSVECFTDLQQLFELGVKIYESFTNGNSDIISIIMQGLPILSNLKTHCL